MDEIDGERGGGGGGREREREGERERERERERRGREGERVCNRPTTSLPHHSPRPPGSPLLNHRRTNRIARIFSSASFSTIGAVNKHEHVLKLRFNCFSCPCLHGPARIFSSASFSTPAPPPARLFGPGRASARPVPPLASACGMDARACMRTHTHTHTHTHTGGEAAPGGPVGGRPLRRPRVGPRLL